MLGSRSPVSHGVVVAARAPRRPRGLLRGLGDRAAAGRRPGAEVHGGSVLAEAAAQPLAARPGGGRGGRPARPRVDRAAAAHPDRRREGRHAQPAAQRVLRARAAGDGVRQRGQPAPGLGRARAGLRLAGQRARHLRGPVRQRVAGRQRGEGRPDPQVQPRRPVPDADRQAGLERRRRRHRATSIAPPTCGWTRRPTSCTWRTATPTTGSSCSTRPPAPTSATGAPTAGPRATRA